MPRPGLASQQELIHWADTVGSRSELPRLIRRLILETAGGLVGLDFPAAEGTAAGGWDGITNAAADSPFVPAGQALWELSVQKSVNAKADEDYAKRTATPDGSPTASATYIAVSLRRWKDRRKWSADKTKDRRWKEVRAYGIDDLETWLESAPVTHAWISEHLGLKPHGLQTAEAWWAAWSSATAPSIPVDLVLAGRATPADRLLAELEADPQIITLQAGSLDEALGFVAAVALRDESVQRGQLLARLALVDDVETFRSLAQHGSTLAIVARTPEVIAEARSAPSHHVIVPLTGTGTADIELPSVDIAEAAEALKVAGIEDAARADDCARLGRRSLLSLRRHLARKRELHVPAWAATPVSRTTRGALLAGMWGDGWSGDQEVLASLTGMGYEDLREELTRLAADEDPLITRVGETWTVVSPFDAWYQLRESVRADDLARLRDAVLAVLLERDPAVELPPDERWMASAKGKRRQHSGDLRSGLATTISLLGALGERVNTGSGSTGTQVAAALVRELLRKANEDATGEAWAVLSGHLPAFAEAAPDPFLDGVRAGVTGANPVLATIFQDTQERSPLFTDSPHTGLLWALESLAWSPDHFGQVIDLLARLAELDPGGRLMNRPENSLVEIFCPWYPENAVTNARRLEVIDALRQRHPDIAWGLMLRLLPEGQGVHHPTHGPRFRDWKPPRAPVTNVEYFDLVGSVADRLIEDANDAATRWKQLLDGANHLPPSRRASVRDELVRRIDKGTLADEGRLELWDAIRRLVARHREFADADWALPAEELDVLTAIEQRLAPTDAVDRSAWLFEDHMPDLGESLKADFQRYETALADRRREAVEAVVEAHGWQGVLALSQRAVVPWMVGAALAEIGRDRFEENCLPLLGSDDPQSLNVATGFCTQRHLDAGWEWIEKVLGEADLSAVHQARLLLCTHDHPKSWERAEQLGPDVKAAYWKEFQPYGLGPDYPHVATTARHLSEAGRSAAAVRLITLYARREQLQDDVAAVATDALEALLAMQNEDKELQALHDYDFETLFELIEAHKDTLGADRVARLEWAYLPALGLDPKADTLQEALATDPSFFVTVLSTIYRRHSDTGGAEPSPEEQRVGQNGYRLLSSWTRPPGSHEGQIDRDALNEWVDTALPLLDEADRRNVGEIHLGHVLASAPADPDGAWPCVEVRDLLERLQSSRVEQGIHIEVFNRRGTTSRSPEAGGAQERTLVGNYREAASRFNDRWPRTAAVLRGLADDWEQQAGREDEEAERRRTGLNP